MKHRSTIGFILLAAALFAAPQISNDLSALKSALGARIRGEIFNAFLNLRSGDGAGDLVTRSADPLLASYQPESNSCAQTLAVTKQSDRRAQGAPRAATEVQAETDAQLAMLIDPASGTDIVKAALSNVEKRIVIGEAATLPESFIAHSEIAMLNSPDSVVDLPTSADALTSGSKDKDAAQRWHRSLEKHLRVAFVASGIEKQGALKFKEEMFDRIGATLTDAEVSRTTEQLRRSKLFKVRRVSRDGAGSSKTAAPKPVRMSAPLTTPVAALVPPDLAPLPEGCATASE